MASVRAVYQGDVVASLDAVVISRQRDGDRPEQTVGHLVAVAYALPVGMGHEAFERSEAAYPHHDEVAGFARGHFDFGQRGRAGFFGDECVACQQQGFEFAATVWAYQFGHAVSLDLMGVLEFEQHSTWGGA